MTIWKEIWSRPARESEANALWDTFCERFGFRPSFTDPSQPGIFEPDPSVVFDISGISIGDEKKVSELFLAAFRSIVALGEELAFLDWQHPSYKFDPHDVRIGSDLPVLPDGDFYIVVGGDLSFGTFGHPWQESLCAFGEPLIERLSPELLSLLPVLRRTP